MRREGWMAAGVLAVGAACGAGAADPVDGGPPDAEPEPDAVVEEPSAVCGLPNGSLLLREHLFGADALPSAEPVVEEDVPPPPSYETEGHARVDRWTFSIGDGFMEVDAFYYEPAAPSSRLVLLHNGHCPYDCPGFRETAQLFLDHGWAVAVVPMPGHRTTIHDQFVEQEAEDPSFLRIFLEPSAFTVAHAETFGYDTFVMVGLSGGGWTAHLYAALDDRILYSAPVAGSLPTELRVPSTIEIGDYEQRDRPIYDLADYETLYCLGASGRLQTQILNEDDPCCFASRDRHEEIEAYARRVNDTLEGDRLGGEFRVVYDDTHALHTISPFAVSVIEQDLIGLGLLSDR